MDQLAAKNNLTEFAEKYLATLFAATEDLLSLYESGLDSGWVVEDAYAVALSAGLTLAEKFSDAFPGYPYDPYSFSIDQSQYINTIPVRVMVDFLYANESSTYRETLVKASAEAGLTTFELAVGASLSPYSSSPSVAELVSAAQQFNGTANLNEAASKGEADDGVQQLYLAYFGRPAEQGGIDYWLDKIAAKIFTLDEIASEFSKANEYADTYGATGHAGLVLAVYRNVLGRDPEDANSQDFWVNRLTSGLDTPASLVQSFLGTDDATDRQNIINRVEVAKYYTAAAGASYDPEEGFNIIHSVSSSQSSLAAAMDIIDNLKYNQPSAAMPVGAFEVFDFERTQELTSVSFESSDAPIQEVTTVGMLTEAHDFFV